MTWLPLPKAVTPPDDVKRVDIGAVGRTRISTPAGEGWDSWFEGEAPSPDFVNERYEPPVQEREAC